MRSRAKFSFSVVFKTVSIINNFSYARFLIAFFTSLFCAAAAVAAALRSIDDFFISCVIIAKLIGFGFSQRERKNISFNKKKVTRKDDHHSLLIQLECICLCSQHERRESVCHSLPICGLCFPFMFSTEQQKNENIFSRMSC